MVASVSKSVFAKVAVCFALLFALANCHSFEDIVHKRDLKRIRYCYNYQTGTDWYGNDLNQQPITGLTSASACCSECNRRYPERVRAYIYRTDYAHCYCKYRAANARTCAVCQGSRDYVSPPPPSGGTCSSRSGVDSYGYDLRGPYEGVTNAQRCCTLCRNYGSRCVAWLWRRDYNRCYLKSRTVPFTNCQECVFGRP